MSTLQFVMINHFCVLVLFNYLYDMDYESESNMQIKRLTYNK